MRKENLRMKKCDDRQQSGSTFSCLAQERQNPNTQFISFKIYWGMKVSGVTRGWCGWMMVNVYKVLDKDVKTKNNRTSKNDGSGSFWEREKKKDWESSLYILNHSTSPSCCCLKKGRSRVHRGRAITTYIKQRKKKPIRFYYYITIYSF